ncbi:MAG: heme-copper oxidase subunit III [Bacteroidetes bacterium]|nr:heme-copper oxidase subunit III [Bacteroidota bacterium]
MEISTEEKESIRQRSYKPMMWLAIISMCMIFGGLTSAYMVRRGDPGWLTFELPKIFYVSTVVIIASSFTMIFAYQSAKKDNFSGVKLGMLLTLFLGFTFIVCQFLAWKALVAQGIFIGGQGSNPAGSFLYVISGAHLVHLTGGIGMLIFVCIKSFREIYHSKNLLGLQLASIFWHFLDLLWVYLFLFLYFAR